VRGFCRKTGTLCERWGGKFLKKGPAKNIESSVTAILLAQKGGEKGIGKFRSSSDQRSCGYSWQGRLLLNART